MQPDTTGSESCPGGYCHFDPGSRRPRKLRVFQVDLRDSSPPGPGRLRGVELSGPEDKLEAFIDLVRPYGIRELARTGVIAMQRGQNDD